MTVSQVGNRTDNKERVLMAAEDSYQAKYSA